MGKTHFKITLEIPQNSDGSWLLADLQKLSKAKGFDAGLFEFQVKKVPVFLKITVCQQRNHQEIRDRLTVAALITRESTNYAALAL